jgi:hypothetical protein
MANPMDQQRSIRARISFLHVVRHFGPLATALIASVRPLKSNVCLAIPKPRGNETATLLRQPTQCPSIRLREAARVSIQCS